MEGYAVSRGYDYGGYQQLAYPFLPFLDPIVILAAFAFIAYLIQTVLTLYLAHQSPPAVATNPGLLGTVVEGLVPSRPTRLRDSIVNDERVRDILNAINLYKENRERFDSLQKRDENSTEAIVDEGVPVPIIIKSRRRRS